MNADERPVLKMKNSNGSFEGVKAYPMPDDCQFCGLSGFQR